jgi:tyrosinase
MTRLTRRCVVFGLAGTAIGLSAAKAGAQPVNGISADFIERFGSGILEVPPKVVRRVNAASLPANHRVLESYRAAINAMRLLPQSDARNWTRIAQVHDEHCAHRNWYTWPWHRAFLTSFERVCRQMSDDDEFRLPYWDWSANRQIPATFSQQNHNGAPNPLFHPRGAQPTDALPDTVVGPSVMSSIIGEPDFEAFMSARPSGQDSTDPKWQRVGSTQGPLESNPHNTIHPWIGGDMATFVSPLDPIFWLHHANLDRIWDRWNRIGNANTSSALWRDFRFNQFVNPGRFSPIGTPWQPRVSDLLDIEALGYFYIRRPSLIDMALIANARILPKIDWRRVLRTTSEVSGERSATTREALAIPLRGLAPIAQLTEQVLRPMAAAEGGDQKQPVTSPTVTLAGRVTAIVEAEPPANAPPPQVRVFLNCDYLSPETPAVDPHYVGSFSFFMAGHGGHSSSDESVRVALDLTRTLLALQDAGRLPKDQLVLQLQPVAIGRGQEAAPIKVRGVEIETAVS